MRCTVKNFLIYFLLVVACLFCLMGCTSVHVDKEEKLSEEEIVQYIDNYMQNKYGKVFNIELLEKENLTHKQPFSFMGVPTGERQYQINGAYRYQFELTDSDNLVLDAYYEDAYFANSDNGEKYYDSVFEEQYEKAIAAKEKSIKLEEIVYQYLEKSQVIKIEFDNKEHVTGIYLNYNTHDISKELLGKLLAIRIDDSDTWVKGYIIFLDDPSTRYSLNHIQELFDISFSVTEDISGEIHESKKEIYNDFCKYLETETTLSYENIKSIANDIFKASQYFMYGEYHAFKVEYFESGSYRFFIHTKTLLGKSVWIMAGVTFDNELNEYKCNDIDIQNQANPLNRKLYLEL